MAMNTMRLKEECPLASVVTPERSSRHCVVISHAQGFHPGIELNQTNSDLQPQRQQKAVRWNSRVEVYCGDSPRLGRIESLSQKETRRSSTSSPPPMIDQLSRQLEKMELKIQESARQELTMLNEAKTVKEKREQFVKMYDAMIRDDFSARLQSSRCTMTEEDQTRYTKSLEQKIEKATRMEKSYLKKSKEIRRRRYRMTKIYELTSYEVERQSPQTHVNKTLPPFLRARSICSC